MNKAQQELDELTLSCTASHKILLGKRVTKPNGVIWETKRDVTQECIKATWAWLYQQPDQKIEFTLPDGVKYSLSFTMKKVNAK